MKKRISVMDLILILIGVSLVIFTVTMIVLFCKFGAIPDTLCTCYFGAVAGECGIMGLIKSMKIRYEDRQWYKEDTEKGKTGADSNAEIEQR